MIENSKYIPKIMKLLDHNLFVVCYMKNGLMVFNTTKFWVVWKGVLFRCLKK
jgi:hypothetical protein